MFKPAAAPTMKLKGCAKIEKTQVDILPFLYKKNGYKPLYKNDSEVLEFIDTDEVFQENFGSFVHALNNLAFPISIDDYIIAKGLCMTKNGKVYFFVGKKKNNKGKYEYAAFVDKSLYTVFRDDIEGIVKRLDMKVFEVENISSLIFDRIKLPKFKTVKESKEFSKNLLHGILLDLQGKR